MTDIARTVHGEVARSNAGGRLALGQAQQVVANIGELLEVLAVGWTEAESTQRTLIAGGYPRQQFIRVPGETPYPRLQQHPGDIAAVTAPYSLAGFLQFEADSMFKGLFEIQCELDAGSNERWWMGRLTRKGFEIASAGLLEFDNSHVDVQRAAFFNPKARRLVNDPALGHTPLKIQ